MVNFPAIGAMNQLLNRKVSSTPKARLANSASRPPRQDSISPTGNSPGSWQGKLMAQPSK
jgi:hypothetical protein